MAEFEDVVEIEITLTVVEIAGDHVKLKIEDLSGMTDPVKLQLGETRKVLVKNWATMLHPSSSLR